MFSSVSFLGVVHSTEHQCSHCAITVRNLLPRVRGFNKMAAECESSTSGSSASSKRSVLAGSTFEKVLHSENSSKGKAKFKISCRFCKEELAYHGATITMHEHIY